MGPPAVGEYTCIMGRGVVGENWLDMWGVDCALLLLGISSMGCGEADSDMELIPDVLEESVLLILFCTARVSAWRGMGRTGVLGAGETEHSAEVLVVMVGETTGLAVVVMTVVLRCC